MKKDGVPSNASLVEDENHPTPKMGVVCRTLWRTLAAEADSQEAGIAASSCGGILSIVARSKALQPVVGVAHARIDPVQPGAQLADLKGLPL